MADLKHFLNNCSMATIYHNPRCSKSRAALQRLQQQGIEPKIIEYLSCPYTEKQLDDLIQRAGISVREMIRSKEALYAELGLNSPDCSDQALIAAMAAHPVLVNRPIVVTEKGVRLCRSLDTLEEIL